MKILIALNNDSIRHNVRCVQALKPPIRKSRFRYRLFVIISKTSWFLFISHPVFVLFFRPPLSFIISFHSFIITFQFSLLSSSKSTISQIVWLPVSYVFSHVYLIIVVLPIYIQVISPFPYIFLWYSPTFMFIPAYSLAPFISFFFSLSEFLESSSFLSL